MWYKNCNQSENRPLIAFVENASKWWRILEYKVGTQININNDIKVTGGLTITGNVTINGNNHILEFDDSYVGKLFTVSGTLELNSLNLFGNNSWSWINLDDKI